MRIISGTMKGTKLNTLDGLNTRPTLDRVKEALFSKINLRLEDAVVLDLFSGSGALGLESVSRGAKKAFLCDNSKDAIKIIKSNVEKTKSENKVEICYGDYKKILKNLNNEKFDIVFIDPPYASDFGIDSIKIIYENDLLSSEGLIVLESDDKDRVLESLQDLSVNIEDIKHYGRVYLFFICA